MTRCLGIICFLAAMGCFAVAASTWYLGFEVWPPSATLADGRSAQFEPADIEVCIKGRGMAWLGDRSGEADWQACQDSLTRYQALTGFELGFWSVIGASLAGQLALFGLALSLRSIRFRSRSFAEHAANRPPWPDGVRPGGHSAPHRARFLQAPPGD
ncbi:MULTISPECIES: hypothetical protein [unclassified Bradyrhizobium]|uniref:hypothetical protein n=1 Tax=unclassified Bradyrhizobium TaxID=2631580 RepID=UPI0028E21728|nr:MULTISPECIES: hypothetical protein [unclassified Bradyrhizobium]